MRISTKGRYGLRAILDIAEHGGGGQIPLKEVAERQGISENYLEQIIFPLKKAGLLQSMRGSQGGYFLARPADEITAGDVLRALEGDLAPVECLVQNSPACERAAICATLPLWIKLRDAINQVLDSTTLQELLENKRRQADLNIANFI